MDVFFGWGRQRYVVFILSAHIVAFFSSMDSKKEKTVDGWEINFLYSCAMSIGRPRPPAPLLPDLLLASPSPGGALLPEHPGRSQPPLQAVQRHHPRPFIASSTLDPTPHPRSFSYRVSFSPTWAPWDDHIINFKITTWSMYFTASPCSTTCEVQKLLLVRVHLNLQGPVPYIF